MVTAAAGCADHPGLPLVTLIAFVPTIPYALIAVGWICAGLGMGLAVSSSSLAAMTLSATSEQGRNASSLNVYDALGSGIFVAVAGTVFAALHPSGNLTLTFGLVELSMTLVALLSVLTSVRIGVVRNEFAAR